MRAALLSPIVSLYHWFTNISLFEFGDLDSSPDWYHLYLRRYLSFCYSFFGYYKMWLPALQNYLYTTAPKKIMELGSGSGDTLKLVTKNLKYAGQEDMIFEMSDLKPQAEIVDQVNKTKDAYFYHPEPVDATVEYTKDMKTPQLYINSFHHFSDNQIKKMIKKNSLQKNDMIILEYVRNTPLGYVAMILGALGLFLFMPLIVKKRDLPKMILFTYVLPLFPLMILWDGVLSCARAHHPDKIKALAKRVDPKAVLTINTCKSILYPSGVTVCIIEFGKTSLK